MVAAVRSALRADRGGDVLVFLPGAGEIERVADPLRDELGASAGPVDVHRLYGALPAGEQDAALAPSLPGWRKVVLATDIAETSLTVEGVRVVVDAGLARRPVFDAGTGLTRLETVAISRASAEQRAGGPAAWGRAWPSACGPRSSTRPGGRSPSPRSARPTWPGLALELATWGTDAGDLPFLDPPPARALDEARRLLTDLGALERLDPPPAPPATEAGAGVRVTDLGGGAAAASPAGPHGAGRRRRGPGWLACLLAALLEDRDVLRGRPDDLPTDVGIRVALLADTAGGTSTRRPGPARRAERARDIARRAGVPRGGASAARGRRRPRPQAGRCSAVAYPDRIAQARAAPAGSSCAAAPRAGWRPTDALAREPFLAVAEVDGRRRNGRIRMAAPLGRRPARRGRRRPGRRALPPRLGRRARRPRRPGRAPARAAAAGHGRAPPAGRPGHHDRAGRPGAVHRPRRAALDRSRPAPTGPGRVPARPAGRALARPVGRRPAAHARRLAGAAAGRRHRAGGPRPPRPGRHPAVLVPGEVVGDLDRLAPATVTVPSGRRSPGLRRGRPGDPPVLAVRVQEMFGTPPRPPWPAGRLPVVLSLLSPAGRPVQVTSDLAGFWAGSWREVRKEMAGRYPKHPWPDDPANAVSRRRA